MLAYRWTADELGDWAIVLGVTGPGATALRAPAVDDAAWHRERRRLGRARRHRPAPERDDKVITEWNALAVSALTEAAVLLERPTCSAPPSTPPANGSTTVRPHWRLFGRLTWADSGTAAGPAALATTLWRHGRITGDPEPEQEAVELVEMLLGTGLDPVETGTALTLAEAITAPRVEAYTPRGGPLQRLAWTDPQPGVLALTGDTPLADGKNPEHAYVCHDRFCSTPTTDPAHFAQLRKAS